MRFEEKITKHLKSSWPNILVGFLLGAMGPLLYDIYVEIDNLMIQAPPRLLTRLLYLTLLVNIILSFALYRTIRRRVDITINH